MYRLLVTTRGVCSRASPTRSHFAVLGLTPRFDVAAPELSAAHRKLQRDCHPDRHANDPDVVRARAAETSARANVAYEVLKVPEARALHLLDLLSPEDEQPDLSADATLLDWVMRMREMLDDEKLPDETRVTMRVEVTSLIDDCLVNLRLAFDDSGVHAAIASTGNTAQTSASADQYLSPEQLQRAAALTVRLKYLTRILDALDEKLPEAL
jgi:curved DNA-binding protein CbpA